MVSFLSWHPPISPSASGVSGFLLFIKEGVTMYSLRRNGFLAVNQSGAAAGSILRGCSLKNKGLRLQISQEQPRGNEGAIRGSFAILDVGDNMHSETLRALLNRPTDAEEVLLVTRERSRSCVNAANANQLVVEATKQPPDSTRGYVMKQDNFQQSDRKPAHGLEALPEREPGNSPEAEPGNEWVTPEAERAQKREEGTVRDPEHYAAEPVTSATENPSDLGVGTVANPD
jgi:hypothetical protein